MRAENPRWNIRRVEHGRGWTGALDGVPALGGRTLGELAAQIAEHDQRQDGQ